MRKNFLEEIERLKRRFEKILGARRRMFFANPDLCIYLSDYCDWGWRYLIKIGAKRGHLCIRFGFLWATVRW